MKLHVERRKLRLYIVPWQKQESKVQSARTRREKEGKVDGKRRKKGERAKGSSVIDSLRFIVRPESLPCPRLQCLSE